jgi:hypothetical protein
VFSNLGLIDLDPAWADANSCLLGIGNELPALHSLSGLVMGPCLASKWISASLSSAASPSCLSTDREWNAAFGVPFGWGAGQMGWWSYPKHTLTQLSGRLSDQKLHNFTHHCISSGTASYIEY